MKILIVTQYFYPENFKSNDIAFELQKRGHEVDALVSIPNYPEGVYYKGYGVFRKRKETINGVKIYRSFQTPRGRKPNGIKLSLNYMTYAFFATIWCFFLSFKKYDCVIVHETSPITQALPAVLLSKIRKIPFYIWVLDIWPDAMSSGGGIKSKKVLNAVNSFVKWVYNQATKILISSKDFEPLILKQGDYKAKLVYFPNWAEDILDMPIKEIPSLPVGFKIMMAGNLGSAQTIKAVMEAARLLKDRTDIKWVFVGDGSERSYIEEYRIKHQLEETVLTLGRYSFEYIPAFYAQADAMLLTLRANFPHLKAVVPARLQSYMAASKPILGMIDGGSANLIREAQCGYTVPAEDYEALYHLIVDTILPNIDSFKSMGMNGRRFFEMNFAKDLCINNLENIIING